MATALSEVDFATLKQQIEQFSPQQQEELHQWLKSIVKKSAPGKEVSLVVMKNTDMGLPINVLEAIHKACSDDDESDSDSETDRPMAQISAQLEEQKFQVRVCNNMQYLEMSREKAEEEARVFQRMEKCMKKAEEWEITFKCTSRDDPKLIAVIQDYLQNPNKYMDNDNDDWEDDSKDRVAIETVFVPEGKKWKIKEHKSESGDYETVKIV